MQNSREINSGLPNRSSVVRSYNEHRKFAPQYPRDKAGVTIAVTPVSYPFESGIAASRQLPCELRLERLLVFCMTQMCYLPGYSRMLTANMLSLVRMSMEPWYLCTVAATEARPMPWLSREETGMPAASSFSVPS